MFVLSSCPGREQRHRRKISSQFVWISLVIFPSFLPSTCVTCLWVSHDSSFLRVSTGLFWLTCFSFAVAQWNDGLGLLAEMLWRLFLAVQRLLYSQESKCSTNNYYPLLQNLLIWGRDQGLGLSALFLGIFKPCSLLRLLGLFLVYFL